MPELKENLHYHLKKHHLGKERAITIRDLAVELWPIRTNDREIRMATRELNMEGIPILTSVHPPYGIFYASTQSEISEYRANLVSRFTSLKERIDTVDKIRLEPEQMELF